jgi:hypothetical protein
LTDAAATARLVDELEDRLGRFTRPSPLSAATLNALF